MTKKQKDPDNQEINDVFTALIMLCGVIIFFLLLTLMF